MPRSVLTGLLVALGAALLLAAGLPGDGDRATSDAGRSPVALADAGSEPAVVPARVESRPTLLLLRIDRLRLAAAMIALALAAASAAARRRHREAPAPRSRSDAWVSHLRRPPPRLLSTV
jgi:hypothetical protein